MGLAKRTKTEKFLQIRHFKNYIICKQTQAKVFVPVKLQAHSLQPTTVPKKNSTKRSYSWIVAFFPPGLLFIYKLQKQYILLIYFFFSKKINLCFSRTVKGFIFVNAFLPFMKTTKILLILGHREKAFVSKNILAQRYKTRTSQTKR